MNPETVSFWADVAAIFLLAQAILITIVLGVGLGFGWWYLRKGRKALGMPLLMAQVYTLRAQHITMRVTDAIANVPISIHAGVTQVTTTFETLWSSLHISGKP